MPDLPARSNTLMCLFACLIYLHSLFSQKNDQLISKSTFPEHFLADGSVFFAGLRFQFPILHVAQHIFSQNIKFEVDTIADLPVFNDGMVPRIRDYGNGKPGSGLTCYG